MKNRPIVIFLLLLVLGGAALLSSVLFFIPKSSSPTTHYLRAKEPVSIVKIEGPIFTSEKILRELEDLRKNSYTKAVVIRLDSPGGAVGPSQEIMEQVLRLRDSGKKVVASMGTVAASGAYYIASACDHIVANPGTITGSIGVIMESFGLQDLVQRAFIEPRVIKSGEYKDAGNPFREMTAKERRYLQDITDDMYRQFVEAVAKNRGLEFDKADALAQGKIYTGSQAHGVGLVDELGHLYHAVTVAKRVAGLPESAKVAWPREPTPFERFFSEDGFQSMLRDVLGVRTEKYLPLWLWQ